LNYDRQTWLPWMKKWKDITSTLKVKLWTQRQFTPVSSPTLARYAEIKAWVAAETHPRKDLRDGLWKKRPRPTKPPTRRLLIEKVSSSRNNNCLGVRFSNYFRNFGFKDYLRCYNNIDAFTYCDMLLTNEMELVLDNRDSLEDPSSTATPFATMPKLSRGKRNERDLENRLKGITDRLKDSQR